MADYYVDTRTMEVVNTKDINIDILPPESYYEYRCGIQEGIIIEKWCCDDNREIDFATTINNKYKNQERNLHMKKNGVNPVYLKAYTVPPSWYKEQTET